jgi:hypothetical protein
MYIRKVAHTDNKNQQQYYTFKLVESLRTERGPRQRTLLNLGRKFSLPEEKWKDLANRIEEIVTGQTPLFESDPEIEALAIRYARKIVGDDRRSFAASRLTTQRLRIISGWMSCLWITSMPGLWVRSMLSMRR